MTEQIRKQPMFMSREQNVQRSHNTRMSDKFLGKSAGTIAQSVRD